MYVYANIHICIHQGGRLAATYMREPRAVFSQRDQFAYILPQPLVTYAAWCWSCYEGPRCMQVTSTYT